MCVKNDNDLVLSPSSQDDTDTVTATVTGKEKAPPGYYPQH